VHCSVYLPPGHMAYHMLRDSKGTKKPFLTVDSNHPVAVLHVAVLRTRVWGFFRLSGFEAEQKQAYVV
jgi:hypothetical protein